jgi:hypothetical protein
MSDSNELDAKLEEAPKPEAAPAEPVKAKRVAKPEAPKSPNARIMGRGPDPVRVSTGLGSGKSLTTHHIQRRLIERGFPSVYEDRDGFWREGTQSALNAFADVQGLSEASHRQILESLFENDDNVELKDD